MKYLKKFYYCIIICILFASCNNSYNSFREKYNDLTVGDRISKVRTKIKSLENYYTDVHNNDTINGEIVIFTIVAGGPIESSEDMYLDFNADSVMIKKIIVH